MDKTTSSLLKGLYHALPRVAWPTALSFIVFACHFGYGGVVNWFLSLGQWQPISRLTYSVYITHVLVLLSLERQIRTSRFISDWIAVSLFTVTNNSINTLNANKLKKNIYPTTFFLNKIYGELDFLIWNEAIHDLPCDERNFEPKNL